MTHEPWGEGSRDIFDKYFGTKLHHKNTWKALKWKMSRHKRVGRNYKKDNILFSGPYVNTNFSCFKFEPFFSDLPKRETSKRKAKENSSKLMEKFLHADKDDEERLLADLTDSDDDSTWMPSKDSLSTSQGIYHSFWKQYSITKINRIDCCCVAHQIQIYYKFMIKINLWFTIKIHFS